MSVQIVGLGRWGVVLGLSACLVGAAGVLSADEGTGRVILTAQKTQKKKTVAKKATEAMPKEEMAADPAKGATPDNPWEDYQALQEDEEEDPGQ